MISKDNFTGIDGLSAEEYVNYVYGKTHNGIAFKNTFGENNKADTILYKPVGWTSSKDSKNNKRIIPLSHSSHSSDTVLNPWTETENVFFEKLTKLLDECAENNGDNNYTLYMNWIGMPTAQTYTASYSLQEANNLTYNNLMKDTISFSSSEMQQGEKLTHLTALKYHLYDKELLNEDIRSNSVDTIESVAGSKFKKGIINVGNPKNNAISFTNIDEFLTAINQMDADYLKENGVKVGTNDKGEDVYEIECTYDIEWWDETSTDSFIWAQKDEDGKTFRREVLFDMPHTNTNAITFKINSDVPTPPSAKEIRFISLKYFEDENQNLVSENKGGLHHESEWRNNIVKREELRAALSNAQNEDGVWTENPQYSYTINNNQVNEIKDYITEQTNENGIEAYATKPTLDYIYNQYIRK